MKKILFSTILTAITLASNSAFAVNVTCYGAAVPNQIGCLVFLSDIEIGNLHNGVFSDLFFMSYRSNPVITIIDEHINPKPSNKRIPSHHWRTVAPTYYGDKMEVYAVMVHGWDGNPWGSYEYVDYDTQDWDITGAG